MSGEPVLFIVLWGSTLQHWILPHAVVTQG
jgi:hypothetical protein